MYDVVEYAAMIGDAGRMSAYCRALERNIKPGSVVLDIGTGFGIMALVACRAGAAKVYAVEPDNIVELGREVALNNGFADRIEFIQAMTTDIELPEKVDGIVSDIRGMLPQRGGSIASLLDARDRFLKPGGWMIAAKDTMWAALVSFANVHKLFGEPWSTEYGFDFSAVQAKAANHSRPWRMTREHLLVAPQPWATLDYQTLHETNVSGEVAWTMGNNAVATGVSVWFDTETAPGIGFSNSPLSERHIYKQIFFAWPEPTEVAAGDRVQVSIRAVLLDGGYIWSWESDVTTASGQRKIAYRQSSFDGVPISRERLRTRGHNFIAEPNDNAWIDRRILDLMDQSLTLGEIATIVLAQFPVHFKDWNAALTRVGDLSERYCAESRGTPTERRFSAACAQAQEGSAAL